jgi:uncharacterized C2H2 Zn-finger protein
VHEAGIGGKGCLILVRLYERSMCRLENVARLEYISNALKLPGLPIWITRKRLVTGRQGVFVERQRSVKAEVQVVRGMVREREVSCVVKRCAMCFKARNSTLRAVRLSHHWKRVSGARKIL